MASKKINTILSLKDKMSQPLVKVSKNVDKVTRDMKRSANQIERWKNKGVKAMDDVIRKSVKVVGAAGAMAGAFAIKVGFGGMKELDSASAKVKSIAKDNLDLNNIQKDLLKNSSDTGIIIEELADAQYSAISSGINAAESMDAAVISSKLAVSGFTDTNSALKLMTSTMNVFGMEGTEAMTEISDKMLTTQNLGVTSVGELANSLGSVTPIAKAAGISLDDVLGATGALTKGGQGTSEAMTGLKGMMSNIIKPTKQASDMAKQLGIDFSTTALKNKGFPAFLEEIKEKTGGNTDQMAKLFGSVQGLNTVLSLTSEEGFKDFNNILGEVQDSTGMTENAYDIMTDTIGFKFDKMKNRVKNTFTEIMNSQSGAIGDMVDKMDAWIENNQDKIEGWIQSIGEGISKVKEFIGEVVDFVKKHEKAITTILIFIGTIYAVIKVVGLVMAIMTAWKHISLVLNGVLMMSPLTWIVLAIAAVVAIGYLLYRNWDLIKEKALELWQAITRAWSDLKENTKEKWDSIKQSALDAVEGLKEGWNKGIENIKETFTRSIDWIKEKWEGVKEFFRNPIKGSVELAQKGAGWVKGKVSGSGKGREFAKGTSYSPAGFARIHEEGGEIRKLSSGETIIPADKSERLLKNKSVSGGTNIIVQVMGNVIGNKQFIDEVGGEVYRKVALAIDNI